MYSNLTDKRAYLNTLGCLMLDPTLVDDIDKPLDRTDFNTEPFYELLYVAIYNLVMSGCQKIDEFSVDSYLSEYKDQYRIFQENNGLEYLVNAKELASLENYDYYYHRLRKYGLLRYYEKNGLDTKFLYNPTLSDKELEKENVKFDNYTEMEIVERVETKLVIDAKTNYCTSTLTTDIQGGKDILSLVESLKETPDVGVPFASIGLNTVARGMRLGKFYLRSGGTGSSKTRQSIMDAAHISIPWTWDIKDKEWKYTGFSNPTLFISTELDADECQTILLATVAGVDEEHILYAEYKEGEWDRITQAAEYIQSSPIYISVCTDFSISDIENIIKKYHNQYGVNYIFFDYMFIAPRQYAETNKYNVARMQEYQLLSLFSVRLKALAVNLNVFILSGTQLNGEAQDMKYKDSRALAGSKQVAAKIDFGCIASVPTMADKLKIDSIVRNKIGMPEVNMMYYCYKCRRGKLTRIIIFSHLDLGCMRERTLFITDYDFNLLDVDLLDIKSMDLLIQEHSVSEREIEREEETISSEPDDDNDVVVKKRNFDW